MTEDEIGEYICQATLSTNQRAFVNTKISLRPEIILSRGEIRTLEEGENVYLECAFVKGIHGTRVWKRHNKIFYEFGSDRISYQNHGGLLEIKNARPSDSGNYSCEGKQIQILQLSIYQNSQSIYLYGLYSFLFSSNDNIKTRQQ